MTLYVSYQGLSPDVGLEKYLRCRYNSSVKLPDALRVLAELSASQWGMVTTAQAAAHGVRRLDLSRLSKAGHLERLAHGVYRDEGAPSVEFESLRTAWLAADPSRTAEARLRDLAHDVVMMGASAASLHGVGDLAADRHELSSPVRRQSQRPEVRYRRRELEPGDVTIAHGLPVTTIERTIADLVEVRTDLSLVADVVRDAARTRGLDTTRLIELLSPLAARNGLDKDDGTALLDHLIALAGLDTASRAEEIAVSGVLGDLVAAKSLMRFAHTWRDMAATTKAMERALRGLNESIAQSVAHAISPALKDFAASLEMPSLAGLEAELAKHISLRLSMQELLGSFGEEWAASLASATAASRADALRALDPATSAKVAELVSTRG